MYILYGDDLAIKVIQFILFGKMIIRLKTSNKHL